MVIELRQISNPWHPIQIREYSLDYANLTHCLNRLDLRTTRIYLNFQVSCRRLPFLVQLTNSFCPLSQPFDDYL